MNAIDNKHIKRRAQTAFLSEDNPGCLLVLALLLVLTVIVLVR